MNNTNSKFPIENEQVIEIMRGLEVAHKKMIDFKKQKKSPIVVSNGDIIEYIDPFSLPNKSKKNKID